jgi:hypothetical protein
LAGAFFAGAFFSAGACFFAVVFPAAAFFAGAAFSAGACFSADVFLAARFLGAGLTASELDAASAAACSDWSALASAIAASAMSGTAQSILRRSGAKLTTTNVTDSPSFITLRALVGVGSAMSRSGTYPRTPFWPIEM